ncbi:hypothetical protein [uncultured Methanobrevibacter sp.]|uniref:hypothetical protein n=1 Tax=uncultured Methanobrevibacter sp. TaxID=253161 RepID=UPI0025D831EB|nr:hypothetical protein [uncultured Methanobrevibacter sp.]
MITITKEEENVLNQIKSYSDEKVDVSIIKEDLGIYEHDLNDLLKSLDSKGLVNYDGSTVMLKEVDKEINTVNSKEDVLNAELNQKEKSSFEIIKSLQDDEGFVSRYEIEGNLLYGELKLSDFRMYHILLSLENKGLIEAVYRKNGDYYKVL